MLNGLLIMPRFVSSPVYAVAGLTSRFTWLSPRLVALYSSKPKPAVHTEKTSAPSNVKVATAMHKEQKGVDVRRTETKETENMQEQKKLDEIKGELVRMFNMNKELVKDINEAKSIQELMSIAKMDSQSQQVGLQIMSVIASSAKSTRSITVEQEKEWMPIIKAVLAKSTSKDISLLNMSVPSMIQTLSALSAHRYNHKPLVKYLTQSIYKNSQTLTPFYCSSLLFSMCNLNALNEDLTQKILNDLIPQMSNKNLYYIMSAVTSVGILRYRHDEFVDATCNYIVKCSKASPSDYTSLATTLAIFNKVPESSDVVKHLQNVKVDSLNWKKWLDLVWSLTVLKLVDTRHYQSVLSEKFLANITTSSALPNVSKVIGVNLSAKYMSKDYNGPFLPSHNPIFTTVPMISKERMADIEALNETLQHYLKNSSSYKTKVDIGTNFYIDAIVHFNGNFTPVSVTDKEAQYRIALVICNYEYYSRGKKAMLGLYIFQGNLLKALGYQVLYINTDHFSPLDSLAKRTAYLKTVFETLKKKIPDS